MCHFLTHAKFAKFPGMSSDMKNYNTEVRNPHAFPIISTLLTSNFANYICQQMCV